MSCFAQPGFYATLSPKVFSVLKSTYKENKWNWIHNRVPFKANCILCHTDCWSGIEPFDLQPLAVQIVVYNVSTITRTSQSRLLHEMHCTLVKHEKGPNCIPPVMKSNEGIFRRKMWKSRQTQIELPCYPNPPLLTTRTALWTSPESHSCWGPLFELTAGGLQHPLALSCPSSPPLPQTLQTVTIACCGLLRGLKPSDGSCSAGKRIHAGRSPESAGGRSLESRSCVLLPGPFTEDHKGKGHEDPWDWAEKGKYQYRKLSRWPIY